MTEIFKGRIIGAVEPTQKGVRFPFVVTTTRTVDGKTKTEDDYTTTVFVSNSAIAAALQRSSIPAGRGLIIEGFLNKTPDGFAFKNGQPIPRKPDPNKPEEQGVQNFVPAYTLSINAVSVGADVLWSTVTVVKFDSNNGQAGVPGQGFQPQAGFNPGQGFDPNQGQQGFGQQGGFNPGQTAQAPQAGFNPGQPAQAAQPQAGFNPGAAPVAPGAPNGAPAVPNGFPAAPAQNEPPF